MAFNFASLCDLLEELEENRLKKALPAARLNDPDLKTITSWFNRHTTKISRNGTSAIAFLSCLFPERRVDRVYGLKEKKLASALGRCLCLGIQRRLQFERDVAHGKDIGECVQRVLREAELPFSSPNNQVSLEEIDEALDQVAAGCRFSSPDLRNRVRAKRPDEVLEPIFLRLQSREAKWLTRMVLKNYSPVVIPESIAMSHFHFLLKDLLNFQDSFFAALNVLQHPSIVRLSPRQPIELVEVLKLELAHIFIPRINVFLRRQPYDKARSIKHCYQLARQRQMAVEQKYDGEYCQVHIDVTKSPSIHIFSKSGKDSTADREKIHRSLREALRLGQEGCQISRQCILEGELLVWNDLHKTIQPFRTIRKQVSRSGVFIGIEQDSPPHPDDHLMIMLYDVMLWDDIICLKQPHHMRRKVLKGLVFTLPGRVDVVERQVIDFRSRHAPEKLRSLFAKSITQRWEGLVLKGVGDAYSIVSSSSHGIKLKKDYIRGLGDTEDFVIIGGSFNAQESYELQRAGIQSELDRVGLKEIFWTTFYLGCLENRVQVVRWDAKPIFRVVGTVGIHGIPKEDFVILNQLGQFCQVPLSENKQIDAFSFTVDQNQLPKMSTGFKHPFIVEVMGAGFDRPTGVNYPMLRFPRIQKIHQDRMVKDTVSLEELCEKAKVAESLIPDADSQEDAQWIEKLIAADGRSKYIMDTSQLTTPGRSSGSTRATPTTVSSGMVRIDSQELTPVERGLIFFQEKSPCFPRSQKRKLMDANQDLSVRGNNSTNPPNLLSPGKRACPDVSLKEGSRNHPLTEISNVSPTRSRHRMTPHSGLSKSARVETLQTDEALISRPPASEIIATKGILHIDQVEQTTLSDMPGLSLVPESSLLTETSQNRTIVGTISIPSTYQSSDLPRRGILTMLQTSLKDQAVFPTFSLTNSPAGGSALQSLERLRASVMFSKSRFLQSCLRILISPKRSADSQAPSMAPVLHIAIVEEAYHDSTASVEAVKRIMDAVTSLVRTGMTKKQPQDLILKHALIFLDWRILDLLDDQKVNPDKKKQVERSIEAHLCGAFMWPINLTGDVAGTWDLTKLVSWLT